MDAGQALFDGGHRYLQVVEVGPQLPNLGTDFMLSVAKLTEMFENQVFDVFGYGRTLA